MMLTIMLILNAILNLILTIFNYNRDKKCMWAHISATLGWIAATLLWITI